MYEYLKGDIIRVTAHELVLEVHGIGYKLFIPSTMKDRLPSNPSTVLIYVSFVLRENSQSFYGFLTLNERNLFDTLLNVSGIGPKIALNLLSHLTLDDLQNALIHKNYAILAKVPGIGKKTAERLILELPDKLGGLTSMPLTTPLQNSKFADLQSALTHLGYSQLIAQKAVSKALQDLPEQTELGQLITYALQHIHV